MLEFSSLASLTSPKAEVKRRTTGCKAVRWERVLDAVLLLDGNVCVYMHVYACVPTCTWVCIFSYPNIFGSKKKRQFPKHAWQRRQSRTLLLASEEALPLVLCVNPTFTLLAFSLTVTGKHNDHCKQEMSVVSSKPFYVLDVALH